MKFFDILKGKLTGKEVQSESDIREGISFDKVDWHYESAIDAYCRINNKDSEDLSDEEYDNLYLYAGNHIGFFIAWIIKHGFKTDLLDDQDEGYEAVKNESISGTEYLMEYCDGKFLGIDVSKEIFGFVNKYYDKYLTEYAAWVTEELHEGIYEFIGTWEEYHRFEHIIDEAYLKYKKAKGEK